DRRTVRLDHGRLLPGRLARAVRAKQRDHFTGRAVNETPVSTSVVPYRIRRSRTSRAVARQRALDAEHLYRQSGPDPILFENAPTGQRAATSPLQSHAIVVSPGRGGLRRNSTG